MQALTKLFFLVVAIFSIGKVMASPVIYTEDKPAITITSDQPTFTIKLKSNPTTGFSWYLRSYDANVLQPVKHVFLAPENKKLIGAPGYELWTFRVKPNGFSVPMQTMIRFVYGRAWEAGGQGTTMVFQVTTRAKD